MKNHLLLIIFFYLTACSVAQKPMPQTSNGQFLGKSVAENKIEPPKFKSIQKSKDSLAISPFSIAKNDFPKLKLNPILQLLNENVSGKNSRGIDFTQLNNPSKTLKAFQVRDYYEISISNQGIKISTYEEAGVYFALASIYKMLNQGKKKLAFQSIKNYPDIDQRIMQVNLKAMDPEAIKKIAQRIWLGHYNAVLLTVHNSVQFETVKAHAAPTAMSTKDFQNVIRYFRDLNIEPIPHLDLLSHQNKCLIQESISPELLYNNQTLDPSKPAVVKLIKELLNELDSLVHPKIIQIGHDELAGHTEAQVKKFGPILPPTLFLLSVKQINAHLLKKNIEVWMWGDMLLYKEDFPDMHPGSLNAPLSYRYLIDSIPKNIVICDWHYKHYQRKMSNNLSFSSIDYFLSKGFKVIGATYEIPEFTRQFAKYNATLGNQKFYGMIATSWHKLLKGTNQKDNDNLQEYDAILEKSADYFWNANK